MNAIKLGVLVLAAAVAAGLAVSALPPGVSGQAGDGEKAAKPDPAVELAKAIETGRKLFNDKTLGAKDKACASCHEDPKKPKLSLAARANAYPKWDKREGRVVTLGRKIDQMIVRMLKGKPQGLGSERLVAIEAYLMSISRDR
jgi:cytochrome c